MNEIEKRITHHMFRLQATDEEVYFVLRRLTDKRKQKMMEQFILNHPKEPVGKIMEKAQEITEN